MFFSNIIAFIAEKHPDIVTETLPGYLRLGFSKVKREAKHTDLTFYDKNDSKKPILVIENKRGAIANEKQLTKYKNKIKGENPECKFLLISPHFFVEKVAEKVGWDFIDYESFAISLNESVTYHSETLPLFGFSMLKATAAYMQRWTSFFYEIYHGITENTLCKNLVTGNNNRWDAAKVKYFAVYQFLSNRLAHDPELKNYTCLFDPGTTNPLVQFNLDEKITYRGMRFQIFLQNGRIEIGFGEKYVNELNRKKERKRFRAGYWKKKGLKTVITEGTKGLGLKLLPTEDNSQGYMGKEYVMCMVRETIKDKTIGAALDLICNIAKGMEKYINKNNNHNINKLITQ